VRDTLVLFIHTIVTLVRLSTADGLWFVVAVSAPVRHQILILNCGRKRISTHHVSHQLIAGFCTCLMHFKGEWTATTSTLAKFGQNGRDGRENIAVHDAGVTFCRPHRRYALPLWFRCLNHRLRICRAIFRPMSAPSSSAERKWRPSNMRASTTSSTTSTALS
jgi:hypothetical protein